MSLLELKGDVKVLTERIAGMKEEMRQAEAHREGKLAVHSGRLSDLEDAIETLQQRITDSATKNADLVAGAMAKVAAVEEKAATYAKWVFWVAGLSAGAVGGVVAFFTR